MFTNYMIFLLIVQPLSFLLSSIAIICQLDNGLPINPTRGGGEWRLLQSSIGVSAMHMQLLHNNKVLIFDRTDFGRSNLDLPDNRCRIDPSDIALPIDCTAHSLLYDIETNTFRPLMVQTDTWCSSGALLSNGTLVQTGGYNDGDHVMRMFVPCDDASCDWVEFPNYLIERRWYATNQVLPDGRVIVVGGRRQFNYEFYPRSSRPTSFSFNFLWETRDGQMENNLYPFIHLLPDGNLFIFANTRSILFNYHRNVVVKEYPQIPGGDPRNYPSSGSSVMLPIDENREIEAEILICGGAPQYSYDEASKNNFIRAVSTCGRIRVSDIINPRWVMEEMPMGRVMGDMVLLPTGDVLIINGAQHGTAGWEYARSPITRPVIYRLAGGFEPSERFSIMSVASRPRLYHSTAILLPSGRVLVGGSNPHQIYNFVGVDFPTDLSLEVFSPPYFSMENNAVRPKILGVKGSVLEHGEAFWMSFQVSQFTTVRNVSVRIIPPCFNTHSISMNQRMVVLKMIRVMRLTSDSYNVTLRGPSRAEIAPPGYYMLFVVHAAVPSSHATWVKIQSSN